MELCQYIGNTVLHVVSLSLSEHVVRPGGGWFLLLTAKRSLKDLDTAAVFQKETGAGLELVDSLTFFKVLPQDTSAESERVLHCDVKGIHAVHGEVTLAVFKLRLLMPATRGSTSSVPIYTLAPPVPWLPTLAQMLALLNRPSYANLTEANESLGIGRIFWNVQLNREDITTGS